MQTKGFLIKEVNMDSQFFLEFKQLFYFLL